MVADTAGTDTAAVASPLPALAPARPGDHLLDGLNRAQVDAVIAPEGRVVVLAGAGSGKTRVLSRRIAWRIINGDVDPQRVLALTFTRKAAAELRDRQFRLGLRDRVPAGTIHSFALTQLRQRWAERGVAAPALVNNRIGLVARILPSSLAAQAAEISAEIDWARARLIEPDDYEQAARPAGRRSPLPAGDLAELMVALAREKRRRRVVDFDDLLALALRDLEADPTYAAAVRWRHRHFFVDEFQDVNPLQFALLQAWLGDRDDLFIVGDPNQAIYSWNGADPSLLESMADPDQARVIRLDDNYRSSPEILRIAGAALARDPRLTAHRGSGPTPTITAHPSDQAEADAIADRIRRCHSVNDPWSDQAVLVRTNAQLVLIEQALDRWHVPCQIRNGPGPLASNHVKAVLKRIGTAGVEVIEALEELDEELAVDTSVLSPTALDRHNNMLALSRLIHEYLAVDPRPTGVGLRTWIGTLGNGDVDTATDAVALATFHSAKGLEWPIVHLAGMEDGFTPIAYAVTDQQRAEEQRLLYVALTRAQHELHLTWARVRTFGHTTTERDASPFLAAIDRRIRELGPGGGPPVNWKAHLASSRHRLADTLDHPGPDGPSPPSSMSAAPPATPGSAGTSAANEADAVLERLRAWRARRARAAQVPAHVIATDATLRAVAQHRPTSLPQLAAITGMRPSKLSRYGAEILAQSGDAS